MCLLVAFLLLAGAVADDLHKQGADFYAQKKYVEAISALEQAVKTEDPNSAAFTESALMIGQSYFMLSQSPKSIPWLEKIPAAPEANYMLGYAYMQAHQVEPAHASFARLFGLPVKSAAAYLLAGQMMLKKEFETEALAEVKKALELNPNMPEGHFILGPDVERAGNQPEFFKSLVPFG
jgi:tetratricopeptide (TPR) repeat protein